MRGCVRPPTHRRVRPAPSAGIDGGPRIAEHDASILVALAVTPRRPLESTTNVSTARSLRLVPPPCASDRSALSLLHRNRHERSLGCDRPGRTATTGTRRDVRVRVDPGP